MLYIILMHISHFAFLLRTYYLLFILYLFQTIETTIDKKQIRVILLFEFKMGHKAEQTTHNINNTFGPGTANERIVQWQFKKFCKGNESIEKEHSGRQSEVASDELRAIIKAAPLTTTQEGAKELNVDHSRVIQYLRQIGEGEKFQ